jgi:hypothetical protein
MVAISGDVEDFECSSGYVPYTPPNNRFSKKLSDIGLEKVLNRQKPQQGIPTNPIYASTNFGSL